MSSVPTERDPRPMVSMNKTRSAAATLGTVIAAGLLGTLAAGALAGNIDESTPAAPTNPWSVLSFAAGYEVESYAQLEGATRSATVSVLGTVTDVALGRQFVETDGREEMRSQMVTLVVSVDQVLTGQVKDGSQTVQVEFGPFDQGDLDLAKFEALIGEQSVYLLRQKGTGIPGRTGVDKQEVARNVYRVINSQGLLDEDTEGTVDAPVAEGAGFGQELEGMTFSKLVDEIDKLG